MRLHLLGLCLALVPACGRFGRDDSADAGDAPTTDAASDAPSGRTCPAKLCVDFDDPSVTPPWGFDEVHAPTPESLGMVPGFSPPNALSIHGTVAGAAYLRRKVPSTAAMVHMTGRFRVDAVVAATTAWLVDLRCSGSGGYNYVIRLQNGAIVLKSDATGNASALASAPPGDWTTIELVATLTASASQVTARLGESAATLPGGACVPESLRIGSSQLDAGDVRISVDDLVLDWR